MYPWISHTLDFWLQFCEKKCSLYMDVYGMYLAPIRSVCYGIYLLPITSQHWGMLGPTWTYLEFPVQILKTIYKFLNNGCMNNCLFVNFIEIVKSALFYLQRRRSHSFLLVNPKNIFHNSPSLEELIENQLVTILMSYPVCY